MITATIAMNIKTPNTIPAIAPPDNPSETVSFAVVWAVVQSFVVGETVVVVSK